MDIGEFSRKTGITIDTLRYYDKISLLTPEKAGVRRCYTEEDLERAVVIIKLKKLNFSLEHIRALFNLEEGISETEELDDQSIDTVSTCLLIIEEKYKEIERREQDILQTKAMLKKMMGKAKELLRVGFIPKNEVEEEVEA